MIISKLSRKSQILLIMLAVAGFIVALMFGGRTVLSPSLKDNVPSKPGGHKNIGEVNIGVPKYLKIPKIDVDADVGQLGITSKGDLDVPKSPMEAGWYKDGPRPGTKGNSVIVGHFGWKQNLPAVFDNLDELQKGDLLFIEDESGNTTKFEVRGSHLYKPNEDASAVFKSTDGSAYLNLITCHGSWDASQKSYTSRLVVFTQKI